MPKRPPKLSPERVDAARERFARATGTLDPPPRKRFAERLRLIDCPGGGVLICDGQRVFTKVASREIAESWLAGARSTLNV